MASLDSGSKDYRNDTDLKREENNMSWVIWITGLPGSGKSTVTEAVKKLVPDAEILSMDELRKLVTPEPIYSDSERDLVYRSLVYTAKTLNRLGHNVIIDATANKNKWRQLARDCFPVFFEVYLKCPLDQCIMREKKRTDRHAAPSGIYEKGRKGWPVPGTQIPYEEPEKPELLIDALKNTAEESAKLIVNMIQKNDGHKS